MFWLYLLIPEFGDLLIWRYAQFLTPLGGFRQITGMLHCYFLKELKTLIFSKCVPNFFFGNCLKRVLFIFKVSSSTGLPCLKSSMFVFVLIIRISKTTCFVNVILMVELEGKLPKVGDLILPIIPLILVACTRFSARTFRKPWSTESLASLIFFTKTYIFLSYLLNSKRHYLSLFCT